MNFGQIAVMGLLLFVVAPLFTIFVFFDIHDTKVNIEIKKEQEKEGNAKK